jgi:glycosyltransferase involved in cell wall biosynthesis
MRVLFYTKVLHNKVGGYVSGASNLIKGLCKISDVSVVLNDATLTREDLISIKSSYDVHEVLNLTDMDLSSLQRNSYDLVFFNGTNENDYLHRELKGLSVPFVTYEHQIPSESSLPEFLERLRSVDLVLVPSESLQRDLYENYKIGASILNIPIDTTLFTRTEFISNNLSDRFKSKLVLLTVCMIKPVRNLEGLIRVFGKVTRSVENVDLIVVGDTPHYIDPVYKEHLLEQINSAGLQNRVFFAGRLDHPDQLKEYYSMADLYVDTSHSETFGQAKAEALSCNLLVATYDLGNNAHLLPNEARCFLAESEDELVQNIVELLNKTELRRRLARQTRKHIETNFSLDITSIKMAELIKNVL